MKFLPILLLGIVCSCLAGCSNNEPIKIGFIGSITGKNADLGVAGRDATLLAAETVNAAGGINGRLVELIVKDDAQNPETTPKLVAELATLKVAAIVGPMGSAIAKAALPAATAAKLVMVSPTSSSNELTGKDDYFFRVMEPNLLFARHQAETCLKLNIRRVAVIYDIQNKTYTVDIFQAFRDEFTRRGGVITTEVTYDSQTKPAFLPLVQQLKLGSTDGVMVLGSSVDSINIGQQIRKATTKLPILSGACGIAQRDLVQQAGKSVDNFIFTLPVNDLSTAPAFVAFRTAFVKRFNYQPTFAAVLAYDAAQAVFTGLKMNPDQARLRETLQGITSFAGLQGEIKLDRYGDPNRKLYICRFRGGREEVVE